MTCTVTDCVNPSIAKGLCMMHYARRRRYGRLSLVRKKPAHYESLIKRLEEQSIPVPECGCMIWLHQQINDRYGLITYKRKTMLAHRAAWIAHHGPIPKGLHVLHRCDTPSCVNHHHLFLGTASDNMQDSIKKGRFMAKKREKSIA